MTVKEWRETGRRIRRAKRRFRAFKRGEPLIAQAEGGGPIFLADHATSLALSEEWCPVFEAEKP